MKIVGLFGKPLSQSISKKMHTANFSYNNDDLIYMPFEIGVEEGFSDAIKATRYLNFLGFNLTKPDKLAVIPLLDELSESARLIGAVNTVLVSDKKLIGHNTDADGFIKGLIEFDDYDPRGKRVTILGAGGAGRACACALLLHGVRDVCILNRTEYKAKSLSEEFLEKGFPNIFYMPWKEGNIKSALKNTDLVINATGIGMYETKDISPIPKDFWRDDLVACDLTYNPFETKFLSDAKKSGVKTINGIGMIVYQGVLAYEIWTGKKANVNIMKDVVLSTLKNI